MEHYTETQGFVQLHFVPHFLLQIPPGETIDSVQGFAFVLDCISMLFRSFVPQIGEKPLVITNDPNRETPICSNSKDHIELATKPTRWSQIAYQFSHELCHYCIPRTVDQNLRWFEESICEAASLFFVQVLGFTWRRKNEELFTCTGEPYADSLIQYAANEAKKLLVFDLKDPVTRKMLESDCYDRKRNRFLANHLLWIFSQHPATWAAVPLLSTLHQPSLEEALDQWILASPEAARPGLLEIRALF